MRRGAWQQRVRDRRGRRMSSVWRLSEKSWSRPRYAWSEVGHDGRNRGRQPGRGGAAVLTLACEGFLTRMR